MKQSSERRDFHSIQKIISQSKLKKIVKCKHCSSKAEEVITPNGAILYVCSNKNCHQSGKITHLYVKPDIQKERFLFY